MATSESYNWTSNRDYIIQEALKKIGALGDYEALDTVRRDVGINTLNPMVKAFHGLGMPLWAITTKELDLSYWTNTNSVTIGPSQSLDQVDKPLKILQATRRDNEVDVDLNIYTHQDFINLSTKTSTGAPVHLHYQPFKDHGVISLWPRPDTYWQTKLLFIRYQRPFQDFDSSTDEPDFPSEWHEALIYNLAVRLAPTYGLPPAERKAIKDDARETLGMAAGFDQEEGSLFIVPTRR